MERTERSARRFDLIALGLILLFAVITRSYNLGFPPRVYFDEVYYARAAGDYIAHREDSNWVHPPLGKILIAAGIMIHRGLMNVFSGSGLVDRITLASEWRLGSLIFGLMMIILAYYMALRLIGNRPAAAVSAFLLSIETLQFAESRIAMIDIFLSFFMLAGSYCAWCVIEREDEGGGALFWSAVFFGLAIACKWSGLFGALGAIVCMVVLKCTPREQKRLSNDLMLLEHNVRIRSANPLVAFLKNTFRITMIKLPRAARMAALFFLCAVATHLIAFIPFFLTGGSLERIYTFITGILDFHYKQPWKHPYLSQMWMWPLMIRPIWYFFEEISGRVYGIVAIGSPLFWWGFLIFLAELLFIAVTERKKAAIFLIISYFFPYIFWIISNKGGFFYYMTPCTVWMCLITAYGLEHWKDSRSGRMMGWIYLAALLLFFMLFYAILIGYPIPRVFFNKLMWTSKWI